VEKWKLNLFADCEGHRHNFAGPYAICGLHITDMWGHSLKPHSDHCREHNLLSHNTYDRHTHCGHIPHLAQTVPHCSTFFWLYVSDDQPYRNHSQPKLCKYRHWQRHRDGCKPYSGNGISLACISVMRWCRQLRLIFYSLSWMYLQALEVCVT